jgi:hypothetical protein
VGFVVHKVALGQVFSKYFGFPCKSSFHQFLRSHHHLIIWGWYNRPVVPSVPNGLSLTPLRIRIIKTGDIMTSGLTGRMLSRHRPFAQNVQQKSQSQATVEYIIKKNTYVCVFNYRVMKTYVRDGKAPCILRLGVASGLWSYVRFRPTAEEGQVWVMLVQRKIGTYSGSQTTVVQYVSGHVND